MSSYPEKKKIIDLIKDSINLDSSLNNTNTELQKILNLDYKNFWVDFRNNKPYKLTDVGYYLFNQAKIESWDFLQKYNQKHSILKYWLELDRILYYPYYVVITPMIVKWTIFHDKTASMIILHENIENYFDRKIEYGKQAQEQ